MACDDGVVNIRLNTQPLQCSTIRFTPVCSGTSEVRTIPLQTGQSIGATNGDGSLSTTGNWTLPATGQPGDIFTMKYELCQAGGAGGRGPNLFPNGSFANGFNGYASDVPYAGDGVYPNDTSNSVQTGDVVYAGGVVEQVAPACSQTWLYTNGNDTGGQYTIWDTAVPGFIVGETYEICFETSNAIAAGQNFNDDPTWDLVWDNGTLLSGSDPDHVQQGEGDIWHQHCVTFVATATTHSFKMVSKTLGVNGNDLGIACLDVYQVDTGGGSECVTCEVSVAVIDCNPDPECSNATLTIDCPDECDPPSLTNSIPTSSLCSGESTVINIANYVTGTGPLTYSIIGTPACANVAMNGSSLTVTVTTTLVANCVATIQVGNGCGTLDILVPISAIGECVEPPGEGGCDCENGCTTGDDPCFMDSGTVEWCDPALNGGKPCAHVKVCPCPNGDLECTDCGLRTTICHFWNRTAHSVTTYQAAGNPFLTLDPGQMRQQGATDTRVEVCNDACYGTFVGINYQFRIDLEVGVLPNGDAYPDGAAIKTEWRLELLHRRRCDGGDFGNWTATNVNTWPQYRTVPERFSIDYHHYFVDRMAPESCCDYEFAFLLEMPGTGDGSLNIERHVFRSDANLLTMRRC